ncbi:MAG: type IVB secretion system protein IcmH/DotU [Gammaproteobacteria bacterium]|nr:type IVB secretion system protein IcmH/DotU [Gammaproteobacteria bacterium]
MASDDSDNQDKTVFKQPVNRGDGTIVRPVPGGRAAGGYATPQPAAADPASVPSNYTRQPNIDLGSEQFKNTYGLNKLVNAASVLIAVFCKTRTSLSHPDVAGLHQQLVREIRAFDGKMREAGVKQEVQLAARYLICTILDEAVLNTPWGAESAWTQKTLLSTFHNETAGGEKFFLIIDRMRSSPAENIEILELMYICISLGYEGKYRVINRGRDALEQLRDELFHIIRTHRGEYERSLSPHGRGLNSGRNSLTQHIPVWVAASVFISVLILGYSGTRYWLHQSTDHVAEQLTEIANVDSSKKPNLFESK